MNSTRRYRHLSIAIDKRGKIGADRLSHFETTVKSVKGWRRTRGLEIAIEQKPPATFRGYSEPGLSPVVVIDSPTRCAGRPGFFTVAPALTDTRADGTATVAFW